MIFYLKYENVVIVEVLLEVWTIQEQWYDPLLVRRRQPRHLIKMQNHILYTVFVYQVSLSRLKV